MTEKNASSSIDTASSGEDDFSLVDIVSALWNIRKFVLSAMLLSALGVVGFLALGRAGIPSHQTFSFVVEFVFPKLEQGTYPNGRPFSINDIIAPSILDEIYRKNELGDYGISSSDFTAAIGITPYAQTYNDVVKRYRTRLANKKLQFAERQVVETNMSEELATLNKKNALLRMTIKKRFGLPVDIGQKIISEIPRTWADISIQRLGVLKLPDSVSTLDPINIEFFKKLDYPNAIYLVDRAIDQLRERLRRIEEIGGSATIVDRKSGHSASSLKQEITAFVDFNINNLTSAIFELGLTKRRVTTLLSFQKRRGDLQLKRLGLVNKAKNLLQVRTSSTPQVQTGESLRRSESTTGFQGTVMPQINEGFIDRLISLSGQVEERIYQRELSSRRLLILDEISAIDISLGKLQYIVGKLEKGPETESVHSREYRASEEKRVVSGLAITANLLNEYWQTSTRLLGILSKRKLAYSGRLYVPLPQARAMSVQTYHPLTSPSSIIFAMSVFIALTILSIFAGLIWQIIRK